MPDTTPNPAAREAAVADARRAVHESLVGLPAWSADEARAKVEALEAAVRAAAIREAAEVAASKVRADHLGNGCGPCDMAGVIAADLHQLAAAPTTVALPFGGHHEACAYVAGVGPYCTCNPTTAAPTATTED